MISIAIFCTAIPFLLLFTAVEKIGAVKVGIITMVGPVAAVIISYFILNERLDFYQILGILIVLSGMFMIKKCP
jgi:drug/metabolite transporter (DMT)-like permease